MSQGKKASGLQLFFRALMVIAVLAIGVAIMGFLVATRAEPEKRARENLGQLVTAVTVNPTAQRVVVRASGQVVPAQKIALSAEVSGRIVWLSDELVPGGRLRAGTQVARIDARDYTLALEAQLAQVDNANTALEIERNRKAIAEREWKLLGGDKPANSVALRDPQMKTAQAALKAARSGVRRAKLSVGKTAIRVPFNAMIQQKSVDLGQLVGPATPIATLVGTDAYWVQVSIPVERLSWIQIPGTNSTGEGSPAVITQKAGDQVITRRGVVIRLLGDLDPVGRMARVLVEIPDPLGLARDAGKDGDTPGASKPELPLLLGSYVSVEITGKEMGGVVEVTRAALRGGDQVFIVSSDKTLEIRKVQVVWRKRDTVLIGSGLNQGEQVIVSPIGEPVAGMKLRLEGADGKADVSPADGNSDKTNETDKVAQPSR